MGTTAVVWVERFNRFLWGCPALILILGTGIYLTLRTSFLPIRKLGYTLKLVFRKLRQAPDSHGVSPFQAVCTALAATVGTGNIAGVAGAIALGGPGALFWMWVAAFLGMVVKYAEIVLAVRYRIQNKDGSFSGGPMYYISQGMGSNWKWLGTAYCIFGVVAAFGVGNSTQISTAVVSMNEALPLFGLSPSFAGNLSMGLILGGLVALVVLGGAKRIGAVAELLIPIMSVSYLLFGLGAVAVNYRAIPQALRCVMSGAFCPRAVTGGAVGSLWIAMRTGVSKGVFTNEAGMGTASMAHAGANAKSPAEQGLYGIFEVFVDTILICTVTALVILTSGIPISYGTSAGAELTCLAFQSVYGSWISVFLALSMILFAFATILGWGLYGTQCAGYLFGARWGKLFGVLHALTTVLGSVLSPTLVWSLAEVFNGLMALPNLLALLTLSPEILRLSQSYLRIHSAGAFHIRSNMQSPTA